MRWTILPILLILVSFNARATHMMAGEITYEHIDGLTYKVTITTYTNTFGTDVDRCELHLDFGDGTAEDVQRTNGPPCGDCPHCGVMIADYIKKNIYSTTHTFPAAGEYIVSFEDPTRNSNIANIENSVEVPFYVQSTLLINPFLGSNTSPILLNPPVDNACVNLPYLHNPGAYDPDGDSLSYEIVPCRGFNGEIIPSYTYPEAENEFSIDPVTGTLLWDFPPLTESYNVAILIKEWRNGVVIGTVTRDMQIDVITCDNQPPQISEVATQCVEAGETLEFNISATDPDDNYMSISATGYPIETERSELIQVTGEPGFTEYEFSWSTLCEDVRKQPYFTNFKVMDDDEDFSAFDLKIVDIYVICPAPENLTAEPKGNYIDLAWDESVCENIEGYRIYRSVDSTGNTPGICETGMPPGWGYEFIAEVEGRSNTTFTDNNNGAGLFHGLKYCYRVHTYYSDGAEGYVSAEACAKLKRDVPIITNVSIGKTSQDNGRDTLKWIKPLETYLQQYNPPYSYDIYRRYDTPGSSYKKISTNNGIDDTLFVDNNLNTEDTSITYRIEMYDGNDNFVGATHTASSIFLNTHPSDNTLTLTWNNNMPWQNDTFYIYRKKPSAENFEYLANTTDTFYMDHPLVNGNEYCYYTMSKGRYTLEGLPNNLINFSQKTCDEPKDTSAPFPPILNAKTDCERMENTLYWRNIQNFEDIVAYNLYYTPSKKLDYSLLAYLAEKEDTSFIHQNINSIAGCYYVTAIDSFENESLPSNIVCMDIDSCELYRLPNVFTPNNDTYNDYFRPFPYDYVDRIHIEIYNRWGQLVYKTENPDIMWDGRHQDSNNDCSEGVYFYICEVYEVRLTGLKKRILEGAVHLYR